MANKKRNISTNKKGNPYLERGKRKHLRQEPYKRNKSRIPVPPEEVYDVEDEARYFGWN